ncbi:MAG: hypothetical protein ACI9QV_000986 [Methylophagaceae bacterium]|jgi:hypothetical protein
MPVYEHSGLFILLVEPSPTQRKIISGYLKEQGVEQVDSVSKWPISPFFYP